MTAFALTARAVSRRRLRLVWAVLAALVLVASGGVAAEPGSERAAGLDRARQSALLDRALADLQPAVPGPPQLFFVGFAGFGYEAVFKREVLAVRKLFDERFGTAHRSVALINHASTVDDVPLASVENLDRVLRHLGSIMDTDRDTLFLFLTSHGERSLLAVEMKEVKLAHLRPGRLKRMLARSGIRNSVIVVSACHAGSFIMALAGPRTLVIAAARADRSSFGCDDRREWTYFGDAYFNRALRQETSFRRAFVRARSLIRQWEAEARLQPSLPQIKGGEALRLAD
jgi:hypothetical protein